MLAALGALAGGGGGGGGTSTQSQSGASTGSVDLSNEISQGNITFGFSGFDDDTVMWVAIAVIGLGAIYFLSPRRS